jgi:alginate O-acetyltransferase complex protein AlgI
LWFRGACLISLGLAKKVIIADSIAHHIDPIWASTSGLTTPAALAAALGFALQVVFDLSGYADMAIGLALLLGLFLPMNFRSPYQALNPSDYWRRNHITLSLFLRDYLYFPLGGNRGTSRRVRFNLVVTMVLGGLWHGANWTFVVWGAYQGALLIAYKEASGTWDALPRFLQRSGMVALTALGLVLFRAHDFATAIHVYGALFSFTGLGALALWGPLLGVLIVLMIGCMTLPSTMDLRLEPRVATVVGIGTLLGLSLILLSWNTPAPFYYYQF